MLVMNSGSEFHWLVARFPFACVSTSCRLQFWEMVKISTVSGYVEMFCLAILIIYSCVMSCFVPASFFGNLICIFSDFEVFLKLWSKSCS